MILRKRKSVRSLKYSDLLAVRTDQPNFRYANALVYPSVVALWEAAIKPLRDSH